MANGYIGKISALVTASTADLSRKLQGSTRDVNRFANSVQSQIATASRAAQASLNGIFTPLQRIERALFAGRRLNLIDSSQVQQIQRAVSVAEGINKPLAAATRQFQGLSAEVQSQFLPALDLAQRRVAGLNDLLARSGNVSERAFGATAERVERTAQAVQRLAQAQRAASAGFTGNELEFTNPRALEAINAAAAASQRAAALPAAQRSDPAIAERVRQLQQFRNVVAQTVAEVEQIRLNPSVNTGALQAAESRLENIVETTRRAQRELDEIVNRGADAQRRAQAASQFLQVDQRESRLQSFEGQATTRDASGRTIQERVAAINATNERAQAEANLRSEQERRIAVANTLFQIDQRESQLQSFEGQATTRDASGRTIQERVAAINATNQRAEAEARLRAEQEARLAVANSLLQVDQRESDLLSQRGRQTPLGDRLAEQGRRRVRGLTGDVNIDSTPPPGAGFGDNFSGQAQRDIDALGTRVGAVRQQLETLPNVVRTRFVPELQRAQAQLVRLQNSPVATVQAIENATRRVERLEAAARRASEAFNFRQSFGGAGLRGIEGGLNQQALRGYTAQLQLLQQTLAGTSQAARGPAVAAFNNLRNAIADAMDRGTLETQQTRQEIQRLTREAVEAAAAAAQVNPRALASRLQRVGDVARGAFGNAGLAIQQAAFAVEDFFSVTGGLDQRIRAAGNNISQLGFITGSTTGLIVGISAAIGAQLVAALIRWSNAGTEAQDRTKALNEALARQKSLVEDLAQAFDSLGDRLLRGVFSPAAEEAREVANQLDEIRRKQRELRDASVIDLDPEVQRQRAIRGARERQLEGEENIGRRIALQEQIAEARRAEQVAAAAAVGRAAPTARDVEAGLRRTVFVDGARGLSPANRRDLEQIRQNVAGAAGDPRQLIQLLQRARTEQERLALQNAGNQVRAPRARENVEALTRLINALERQLGTGIDAAANRLVQSIDAPARRLRDAQDRLREAVEAGVPGAAAVVNSVNEIGAGFDAARQTLVDRLEQGLPLDQATVDAATRQRDAALANVEATLRESAAIDIARQALDRFAAALDRASQEAQSNLQSAQQAADEARRADLARSTPATRQAREQADADLARQRELASGVEEEVAAVRDGFRQRVTETRELRRRAELAAEAVSRASEVTRRAGAVGIEGGGRLYSKIAADARAAGDEDLARFAEETEQLVIRVRESLGLDNENLWQGVREAIAEYEAVVNDAADETARALARIAEIDSQLGSVGVLAPGRREELVRERARLEQQAVEADEQVRRARDESTAEAERAAAAVRGRELSRTDGERAAADLTRGLEDIRQFFGRQAEEGTGLVDFGAQAAAQQRFIDQSLRQAAPAIFALADQVQNAVLQGPSRAALQATDVSTVEGSRELNRLLRGDDSARDQNLVELQKQSQSLEELVRIAREGGAQVAN